jgi:hypothetical protein
MYLENGGVFVISKVAFVGRTTVIFAYFCGIVNLGDAGGSKADPMSMQNHAHVCLRLFL